MYNLQFFYAVIEMQYSLCFYLVVYEKIGDYENLNQDTSTSNVSCVKTDKITEVLNFLYEIQQHQKQNKKLTCSIA